MEGTLRKLEQDLAQPEESTETPPAQAPAPPASKPLSGLPRQESLEVGLSMMERLTPLGMARRGLQGLGLEEPTQGLLARNTAEIGTAAGSFQGAKWGQAAVAAAIRGAGLGSRFGVPGAVAGGLVGGVAGAGGFNFMANTLSDHVARMSPRFRELSERDKSLSLDERLQIAAREALYEAAFGGAAATVPFLLRGGMHMLQGVYKITPEIRAEARKVLDEFGINLGIGNVAQRFDSFNNLALKTLTMFPLTRAASVKAAKRIEGELTNAATNRLMFNNTPLIDFQIMGADVSKLAHKNFKIWKKDIAQAYDNVRKLAKVSTSKSKTVGGRRPRAVKFSTDDLRATAQDATALLRKLEPGEALDEKRGLGKLLLDLRSQPVNIDYNNWEGIMDRIREVWSGVPAGRQQEIMQRLHKSARAVLQASDSDAVHKAQQAADRLFTKRMALLDSKAAKAFQKTGAPSSGLEARLAFDAAAEDALKQAFDLNSPARMLTLRKIVGIKGYNDLMRNKFDSLVNDAIVRGGEIEKGNPFLPERPKGLIGFDVDFLRKNLGLDSVNNPARRTWQSAFKTMGPKGHGQMERVERFLDALESTSRTLPGDVNAFQARRIALTGARGTTSLILPGHTGTAVAGAGAAAGSAGLVASGAVILGINKFAQVMTNPRALTALTRAMDPDLALPARQGALNLAFQILSGGGADEPGFVGSPGGA